MLAGSISKFKIDFIFSGLTESGCHDIEKTTTNSFVVQLILLAPSCGRKKNSLNFPLLIYIFQKKRNSFVSLHCASNHFSFMQYVSNKSLICNFHRGY